MEYLTGFEKKVLSGFDFTEPRSIRDARDRAGLTKKQAGAVSLAVRRLISGGYIFGHAKLPGRDEVFLRRRLLVPRSEGGGSDGKSRADKIRELRASIKEAKGAAGLGAPVVGEAVQELPEPPEPPCECECDDLREALRAALSLLDDLDLLALEGLVLGDARGYVTSERRHLIRSRARHLRELTDDPWEGEEPDVDEDGCDEGG